MYRFLNQLEWQFLTYYLILQYQNPILLNPFARFLKLYDMLFEEDSGLLEEMEKQNNLEINFTVNTKLHREKYYIES